MKQFLIDFLEDFAYSADCAEQLLSCYDAIAQDQAKNDILQAALTAYEQNLTVKYAVLENYVKDICNEFSYHEYTVWLLLYILMSKRLLEVYRERGISDSIWKESMNDLKYKAEECILLKGIHGTFVPDWFPGFFYMRRFSFGRLQFELARFSEESFACKNGQILKKGDRTLAVHIPRSPMPFSKEACDNAYSLAAKFFADEFPGDYVIFTCGSWLLYPKNSEFLHEKSNVRRFGEDFEIVSVTDYPIGENPNIWRIFDVEFNGNLADLPEDTHLRRAYKQYMMDGNPTGRAYGVKLVSKN